MTCSKTTMSTCTPKFACRYMYERRNTFVLRLVPFLWSLSSSKVPGPRRAAWPRKALQEAPMSSDLSVILLPARLLFVLLSMRR